MKHILFIFLLINALALSCATCTMDYNHITQTNQQPAFNPEYQNPHAQQEIEFRAPEGISMNQNDIPEWWSKCMPCIAAPESLTEDQLWCATFGCIGLTIGSGVGVTLGSLIPTLLLCPGTTIPTALASLLGPICGGTCAMVPGGYFVATYRNEIDKREKQEKDFARSLGEQPEDSAL